MSSWAWNYQFQNRYRVKIRDLQIFRSLKHKRSAVLVSRLMKINLNRLLERFRPEFRERQIEVHDAGELVAIDTIFVGTLNGVGRVYLQIVLDCYSRFAFSGLHNSEWPLMAVHVLNTGVLPLLNSRARAPKPCFRPMAGSIAAGSISIRSNCSCNWKASSIARPVSGDCKAMASSNGCTAPYWTSTFTLWVSRPSMNRLSRCRRFRYLSVPLQPRTVASRPDDGRQNSGADVRCRQDTAARSTGRVRRGCLREHRFGADVR